MNWNLRKIICEQLSVQIVDLPLQHIIRPSIGWIKAIRKAFGMTSEQLAKKCGLSKQRILRIEQDEILGLTTLVTLEKIAKQLDCKLVYGFVPQKTFERTVLIKAAEKAREKLARVSHTMALENQGLSRHEERLQYELLINHILDNSIKSLWD